MNCRVCGTRLEHTGSHEGRTGAVHDRYYCPDCRAKGCLSANLAGRGRSVTAGGHFASPRVAIFPVL